METPTVIVGAGPAGLSVAGLLRRAERSFVIIDSSDTVGASWRRHYDRLHLHTPKRHSSLPGLPMGSELPQYPSRQQVVEYLESYARELGIEPRFGETAMRIERESDGRWTTATRSHEYRSRSVVVATGYNHVPHVPEWPGMADFTGAIVHSRDYKNGEPFRGKRVLVVGTGNTGAEITLCLDEHGAESIALCVRGKMDVVPKKFLGIPITDWAIANSRLPLFVQDAITRSVSRLSFGDLRRIGLEPSGRPISRIVEAGRIPLIDIGTVDLVRRGRVRVVGGIERVTATGVVVPEGELELDAVILATGYRTILKDLIAPAAEGVRVLDERGYPNRKGVESELEGLFFVGFRNPPTGLIRSIGIDARRAVSSICAR